MALLELLDEPFVKIPLEATHKSGVIGELVFHLKETGKVGNVEAIVKEVEAREALFSTGLGKGIAVPHAKTTAVSELVVALGISPAGIDFDALDGELAQIFFMILVPPELAAAHMQVLTDIAKLSQSSDLLKTLVTATSAQEVIKLLKA